MRLFALCSYYDEPRLADAIRDAIDCGCTHVVLLDGAYKHYPHLNPTSPPDQEQAVIKLCAKRDVTLISTAAVGATEAQKRTLLFDLAYQHGATEQDWLFVQDGDQTIANKRDLKPLLRTARHDVYDTLVLECAPFRLDDNGNWIPLDDISRRRWVRQTFRAIPGLHVDPHAHWRYLDAQGRILWGYNAIPSNGDLPIVIHNDSTGPGRGNERIKGREGYYRTRTAQQLEHDAIPSRCYYCPAAPTEATNTDIHFGEAADGRFGLSHRRTIFTCTKHKRRVQHDNTYALAIQKQQAPPHLANEWYRMMREREPQAAA